MSSSRLVLHLVTGATDVRAFDDRIVAAPGEAVLVRCTPSTTFEEILEQLARGFGLVDEGDEIPADRDATIPVIRAFLEKLPPDMRPMLVLENGEDLPRGVVDRLRCLAPAPCAPATQAAAVQAEPAIETFETGRPSRVRVARVAVVILIGVVIAALLVWRFHPVGRSAATATVPEPIDADAAPHSGVVETPLVHAPAFVAVIADSLHDADARDAARRLVESAGVPAFVEPVDGTGPVRLLAGPYMTRAEAEAMVSEVKPAWPQARVVPLH
jgi:hypothetical protein